MSVRVEIKDHDIDSLTIQAVGKEPQFTEEELSDIEEYFPEITMATNEEGITYFHVDLWAGPDFLDHIISYLESHPVPGTYTVEELGLYDVPFVEVLKAIKKLYEQKLTTPTQK